ncbi:MAG: helix-turn-helix domain-containing protein [Clostridia bacterium]|nr:helix-turn-helix domain-containing protein [Clostridia bacterium]
MKTVTYDIIHETDRQEELPGYSEDYPCIMTRAELDRYPKGYVPWHWHQPVELFYMASGELEYHTPEGMICFPEGTGGLVNSGVIHMTRPHPEKGPAVQLLHIFDPFLLADSRDGRVARRYILPVLNSNVEVVPFYPETEEKKALLALLQASFRIDEGERGCELILRAVLSEMWLKILDLLPDPAEPAVDETVSTRLKRMLAYIQAHFAETIRISDVAAAGLTSERDCYRLFQNRLHCSPNAYITGYRLQKACRLLRESDEPITSVSLSCGFGSSSHFGRLFAERYQCTPRQYRSSWQDRDKTSRK